MINYVEEFRSYSSCEVADALAHLGLIPCHMEDIRILSPGHPYDLDCKVVGHAHVAKFALANELPKSPVSRNFVDTCTFGCVAVISVPKGVKACNWGGLLTARAKHLGVLGAVVDGNIRDLGEIREEKFPVFSKGTGNLNLSLFTTLRPLTPLTYRCPWS